MANSDAFEELAQKVQELWLEACRARLERLAESWDPWIRAMLTEPLPDDWLAEIDRFVENTRRSIGLIIAPHSIGQIEDLIHDRAGGTGVFAAIGPAPVQGSDSEHYADSPRRLAAGTRGNAKGSLGHRGRRRVLAADRARGQRAG